MKKEDLIEFFRLENAPDLLKIALTPRSCGGGDEFKTLALEGDKILDASLIKFFQKMQLRNSGEITQQKLLFHNERTLTFLGGEYFELQNFMRPLDVTYKIQKTDLKEAIEALIGASARNNGSESIFEIVERLYGIALNNDYMDFDYISELNKLIQQDIEHGIPKWGSLTQIGGMSHNPIFTITVEASHNKKRYSVVSDPSLDKKSAKRSAAKKILLQILKIPNFNLKLESNKIIKSSKKTAEKRAQQSIFSRQIIFSKSEQMEGEQHMNISVETGEKLSDWAIRKAKKNPFGMLIILSSICSEVKGSSWSSFIDFGELILLNLALGKQNFFEIGFGVSKSQARKDAANKIIQNSHIFNWLEENYGNLQK